MAAMTTADMMAPGKNPRDVFVVEAGADYPQFATILMFGSRSESRDA